MSFLKENGIAALLLAAIFMSLGFILGKVSNCKKGGKSCHGAANSECVSGDECPHSSSATSSYECSHSGHGSHAECTTWISEGDEMIIVKTLMDEGFEGDTILTIPGGQIILSNVDGEMNVEVEVDEYHVDHSGHVDHTGEVHEIRKEVKVIKTSVK